MCFEQNMHMVHIVIPFDQGNIVIFTQSHKHIFCIDHQSLVCDILQPAQDDNTIGTLNGYYCLISLIQQPFIFHHNTQKRDHFRLYLTEIHLPLSLRLEVGDFFQKDVKNTERLVCPFLENAFKHLFTSPASSICISFRRHSSISFLEQPTILRSKRPPPSTLEKERPFGKGGSLKQRTRLDGGH
ncbi:hypothetical protein LR69_02757 [Geobacillus sp. BCO2]|nr:hypothetical protein LR69_02757 [Geobacillus sp. BCO2]